MEENLQVTASMPAGGLQMHAIKFDMLAFLCTSKSSSCFDQCCNLDFTPQHLSVADFDSKLNVAHIIIALLLIRHLLRQAGNAIFLRTQEKQTRR